MNTKLITALRTAATAVENETFNYDWKLISQCNCGVVICSLLGLSADGLSKRMESDPTDIGIATWTEIVGSVCPVSGIPESQIFRELYSLGLTAIEIRHLEYLDAPEVVARIPVRHKRSGLFGLWRSKEVERHYDDKDDLVTYLRAWADLLTERGADDMPPFQPQAAISLRSDKP